MKKRIKIYKSKKEKEEFEQKFRKRLSMQIMLMESAMKQQKEIVVYKNKFQYSFSAS